MDGLTVSYARVSTANQREAESISTQRHALAQYFEARGIVPDRQFEDDGVSGGIEIHKRPQGRELYRLVGEGRVKRLFVFSLDRIGRNTIDSLAFLHLAESHGCQVIGISDGVDTNREDSRLETEMRTVIAAQYRRDRMKATKAGLRRRASQGKISNRPPFGFALDDGRLVIDEAKAEVMRLAFRSVAQGIRTREIVAGLNESGALSPTGGRWRHDTLIYLLRHTAYAGEYRSFITPKRRPGGGARIQRDPADAVAIECPAIVSRSLFDAVQERLTFNRTWCANGSKRLYLLKSLLRCGTCGLSYVGHSISGRRYRDQQYTDVRYYECGSCSNRDYEHCGNVRLNADRVERAIWSEIESFILSPSRVIDQLVSRYNRKAQSDQRQSARELRRAQQAQRQNAQARERLTMAVAKGVVSDGDARSAFAELSREAEALAKIEADASRTVEEHATQQRRLITTQELLRALKDRVDSGLTPAKKAEIARLLIRRGVVKPSADRKVAVTVEYQFTPICFAPIGSAFANTLEPKQSYPTITTLLIM